MNILKPLSISSKLSRLLLPGCLCVLFLTGCNQGSSEASSTPDTTVSSTPDTTVTRTPDTTVTSTSDTTVTSTFGVSVDLGSDLTVNAGESVQLTASIQNQDQDIISYQWVQTSGNDISQPEDNNSYFEFIAPEENDILEFELTVTDSQGMEYTDSVVVTVLSADESVQNTAQLSWAATTLNEDGSLLTNLSGYKIHYGESATNLNTLISVNAQQTSYDIDNLDSDQSYFFCVSAYNSLGLESQCSETVEIIL
ncbi:MAG: fibronectin type III domain-containing protein [Psychromonas sp.]